MPSPLARAARITVTAQTHPAGELPSPEIICHEGRWGCPPPSPWKASGGSAHHLNKAPGSDTWTCFTPYYQRRRQGRPPVASLGEHRTTRVIKQARKRLSMGEAQATLLVLLQDFREGKRAGHGGTEQEEIRWGCQVKARA